MADVGGENLAKIVVVTRGRTGSSAITQELGAAPGCHSEQEVFSRAPGLRYYDFPPFEAWRKGRAPADEADLANGYLDALEAHARERGARALFWKLLSAHFEERPYIGELLARRSYRAVYLRRGLVRQVLSGFVAEQRGVFNTYRRRPDRRRYDIDVEAMRQRIAAERFGAARDEALLYKHRLSVLDASYEDYVADRAGFFAQVFQGLGLPVALPQPSRFVVMIPDPKAAIANYDAVSAVAEELGERL